MKYFCRLAPYQKNHYLLCASAYAAGDYARIGLFRGKALKWGYFPETKTYDLAALFERKRANRRPVILWVARFIGWKHPEVAVELAEKLKQAGYAFDLNMIGSGKLEEQIRRMIRRKEIGRLCAYAGHDVAGRGSPAYGRGEHFPVYERSE